MLIHCSLCERQIADDAHACPGCGHPLAAAQRGRFTNLWLLLAVLAVSGLHSAFSLTGDDAYDEGAFVGHVLGCILFAALIYFVVWLIRGRKRNPHANRFILKTALVLATLTAFGAAMGMLQHPSSQSSASDGPRP